MTAWCQGASMAFLIIFVKYSGGQWELEGLSAVLKLSFFFFFLFGGGETFFTFFFIFFLGVFGFFFFFSLIPIGGTC